MAIRCGVSLSPDARSDASISSTCACAAAEAPAAFARRPLLSVAAAIDTDLSNKLSHLQVLID